MQKGTIQERSNETLDTAPFYSFALYRIHDFLSVQKLVFSLIPENSVQIKYKWSNQTVKSYNKQSLGVCISVANLPVKSKPASSNISGSSTKHCKKPTAIAVIRYSCGLRTVCVRCSTEKMQNEPKIYTRTSIRCVCARFRYRYILYIPILVYFVFIFRFGSFILFHFIFFFREEP